MARIPYPDLAVLPQKHGELARRMPPRSAGTMLMHSPDLAQRYLELAGANFSQLELPVRERELLVLIVASLINSQYEYDSHASVSEAAGVDPAVREALWRQDFDSPTIAPGDRGLVDFVRHCIQDHAVPESEFNELAARYTTRQMVEIVELIGFYLMHGLLCTVLDLDLPQRGAEQSISVITELVDRK